ncbi:MAG TPA: hypothetical protein VHY59_11455, partial [Chthoniobacterales bacterium]|nr:hypothetical protein [Chthoniobacterales bacterium]
SFTKPPEAIEKWYADFFQKVQFSDHIVTVDQDSPHIFGTDGKGIWATGAWSSIIKGQNFGPTQIKGYWSVIREGDDWKIRNLTFNGTLLHKAYELQSAEGLTATERPISKRLWSSVKTSPRSGCPVTHRSRELRKKGFGCIAVFARCAQGQLDELLIQGNRALFFDVKTGRVEVEEPSTNVQLAIYAMLAWVR